MFNKYKNISESTQQVVIYMKKSVQNLARNIQTGHYPYFPTEMVKAIHSSAALEGPNHPENQERIL